jgi:hypothetical protein
MTAIYEDAPDLSTAVEVTIKAAPDGAAAFPAGTGRAEPNLTPGRRREVMRPAPDNSRMNRECHPSGEVIQEGSGAAGTRTQNRRIMSPARQ